MALNEGQILRDEGIARVSAKVRSPEVIAWAAKFWRSILDHAAKGEPFSSDDIRRACPPPAEDETYNPNQISAMFAKANRSGAIAPWHFGNRSSIPSRHAGKTTLYKGVG